VWLSLLCFKIAKGVEKKKNQKTTGKEFSVVMITQEFPPVPSNPAERY